MRVKALREHNNSYGDKVTKTKGAEYDLPDSMGETLISAGLVEEVSEQAVAGGKGGAGKRDGE